MIANMEANKEYIAACGLYCGACRKFISGKCPGCRQNEKAAWRRIGTCAIESRFSRMCRMYQGCCRMRDIFKSHDQSPVRAVAFSKDEGDAFCRADIF